MTTSSFTTLAPCSAELYTDTVVLKCPEAFSVVGFELRGAFCADGRSVTSGCLVCRRPDLEVTVCAAGCEPTTEPTNFEILVHKQQLCDEGFSLGKVDGRVTCVISRFFTCVISRFSHA
jgi:hypothetical protein